MLTKRNVQMASMQLHSDNISEADAVRWGEVGMVRAVKHILSERLDYYGITSDRISQVDLIAVSGQTTQVSANTNRRSRVAEMIIRRIPIKSISQLKRLIGVPETIVIHLDGRRVMPAGETVPVSFTSLQSLSPTQLRLLQNASDEYLYGSATSVSVHEPALNKAIALVNPVLTAAIFGDITVEAGAILEIDGSLDLILANRITVRQTGTIRILGGQIKFDCRKLQSEA
jgi:hypothetical protein